MDQGQTESIFKKQLKNILDIEKYSVNLIEPF